MIPRRFVPALALFAPLVAACEEETLRELHSRILVCAEEDTEAASCNAPLDLGALPITVEHRFELFVRDAGDAPLEVSRISTSDERLTVEPSSLVVPVAKSSPVTLTLIPDALGSGSAALVFDSDDDERPHLALELRWQGVEKPAPRIELCDDDTPACGVELEVDFGLVRRSQRESRTVRVRNAGNADLEILEVRAEGGASDAGELVVATSTRPGVLAPSEEAPVVLVYEPVDGGDDELRLVFVSDDPVHPEATLLLKGRADDNLPPVADARLALGGETSLEVTVGDPVALDGALSSDPEGDPLLFSWSLLTPAGSGAFLDDPTAGRVTFVPDRAGSYRAELVVMDSLGQQSAVPAVVLLHAVPRYAVRVRLDWSSGGDVDLHLVPAGEALFSERDCFFEQPRPDLGVMGASEDDPELLEDATLAPGVEEIVVVAPAPGTYRVYAHYFDEAGAGPAEVRARITLDDGSFPALDATQLLGGACALWYVGDVGFPGGGVMPAMGAVSSLCP